MKIYWITITCNIYFSGWSCICFYLWKIRVYRNWGCSIRKNANSGPTTLTLIFKKLLDKLCLSFYVSLSVHYILLYNSAIKYTLNSSNDEKNDAMSYYTNLYFVYKNDNIILDYTCVEYYNQTCISRSLRGTWKCVLYIQVKIICTIY